MNEMQSAVDFWTIFIEWKAFRDKTNRKRLNKPNFLLGASMFFVYLIIALAAGVALATQSAINTQLAKAMSGEAVIATFISFAVGTIVLFFIAWVKTDLWGNLSTVPSQPWWKLIGGILGAVVVFTTVLLAPKLGITAMLFFIIVGQLITATTIDHFGLIGMPIREVNITKFIGLIIVAFGLVFYFFGDKLVELFGTR